MKITPESLREAAIGLGKLGEAVKDPNTFPPLHTSRATEALPFSPISAALAGADQASDQAGTTLASRFAALGQLLYTTAATFQGKDKELAGKLTEFGDLNAQGS